jgi:hypothetical protein
MMSVIVVFLAGKLWKLPTVVVVSLEGVFGMNKIGAKIFQFQI